MTQSDQRRLSVADPANTSTALEAALFEIKRVIVGQEGMLERFLVALLSRGICCWRVSRVVRQRTSRHNLEVILG